MRLGLGVVKDAPKVTDLDTPVPGQPDGIADRLPYVYFTVVALDGIQDLFSERTLTLGLLDADQQKLAEALRLRWELSQQYWSAVARFGTERWPLEDLPWQTTGLRLESEYFSSPSRPSSSTTWCAAGPPTTTSPAPSPSWSGSPTEAVSPAA